MHAHRDRARSSARWTGECRRCLETTGGEVKVGSSEMFEPDPVEGETYRLGRDHVDLAPALRDALALALPLAPLCDEACAGPDPDDHPVTVEDEVGAHGANGTTGPRPPIPAGRRSTPSVSTPTVQACSTVAPVGPLSFPLAHRGAARTLDDR